MGEVIEIAAEKDTRYPLTDSGNAERFAARNAETVRYVHGLNRWLVWDGARWAFDDRCEVTRRAKDTARSMHAEAQLAGDPKVGKKISAHAWRSERRPGIEAMLALARAEPPLAIVPDDLDRDPDLFNVENGTLDLRTGQLGPHRPEDLITKLAPVVYDPAAVAPVWRRFLEQVIPDVAVREYLQRAVACSLTAHVYEHALFFNHGGGRNGKSTFLETLLALFGDYAKSAPHNLLLATKQDRHAAEIATLMGYRFVTAVEAGEGRTWDEAKVKHLTGGDTISARWMYGNPFTFRPSHKFWVAANHKPRVTGTDLGFWRRVHLIPWTVTIPEDAQDKELPAKLRAELPGILAWAVEGCLAWRRDGLRPPPAVLEATRAYRSAEDIIGAFLDECTSPGERVLVGVLHGTFQQWAEKGGERAMSKRAFGDALADRGFERAKVSGGQRWVLGLRLRGEEDE